MSLRTIPMVSVWMGPAMSPPNGPMVNDHHQLNDLDPNTETVTQSSRVRRRESIMEASSSGQEQKDKQSESSLDILTGDLEFEFLYTFQIATSLAFDICMKLTCFHCRARAFGIGITG